MVFVHNLGHRGQGKFCYLVGGGSLAVAELIPCDLIPTGEIWIPHSRVMSIVIFDIQPVYEKDLYESFDPKATYKDFLKDEWSIKQYCMSYYIYYIIDQLIQIQDTISQVAKPASGHGELLCKQQSSVHSGLSSAVNGVILPTSPTSLHIQVMGDIYHNKAPDVNFPELLK